MISGSNEQLQQELEYTRVIVTRGKNRITSEWSKVKSVTQLALDLGLTHTNTPTISSGNLPPPLFLMHN